MKFKHLLLISTLCLMIGCQKDSFQEQELIEQGNNNSNNTETPKDTVPQTDVPKVELPEYKGNLFPDEASLDRKERIFRTILNAVMKREKSVDVRQFDITYNTINGTADYLPKEGEESKMLFDELGIKYPYLFHALLGNISTRFNDNDDSKVAFYNLKYSLLSDELESNYRKIELSLEEFLGGLQEGMQEVDVAYSLYNDLIKSTTYEFGSYDSEIWGPLVRKKGICGGYASTYQTLLSLVGIKAAVVKGIDKGQFVGHAWTRMQIDGQWYNTDPTWDDVPLEVPYAAGVYFLTSDDYFYNKKGHTPHMADLRIPDATSMRFDEKKVPFFRYNKTMMQDAVFKNGYWYSYARNFRNIFKTKIGESFTVIKELSAINPKIKNRVFFGTDKIQYIDQENNEYYLYFINYDGSNVQKIRKLEHNEISISNGLSDVKVDTKNISLRAEIGLSTLKDLYFHGDEDYFKPQHPQRIELLTTIRQGEEILKQKPVDEKAATSIAQKLHNLRKNYSMPISAK